MLSVDKRLNIFVDNEMVSMSGLEAAIQKKRRPESDTTVYLKADREVPYGIIVSTMDIVKRMGIDKLGMITEPLKEGK
jgi:biopolymer transport protein TolR